VLVAGDVSIELVVAIAAAIISGAPVSVITATARQRRNGLAAEVAGRAARIDARAVLVDDLAGLDIELGDRMTVWGTSDLLRDAGRRPATDFEQVEIHPDSTAVLQFTSGATGDAAVVQVSHRNVTSYFAALHLAIAFDPTSETLVSWLPLSHDMGLIGYLFGAFITGAEFFLASPDLFIVRPHLWLSWISRFSSVHSAAPSFAYGLVSRGPKPPPEVDLKSWRFAFNGSEQISVDDLTRFCDRMWPVGFRRESLVCSYGLAEATLAVTAALGGSGPTWDVVNRQALMAEGVAGAAAVPSADTETLARLGRPLSCVQVRIADRVSGRSLPERQVGEIQVSGSTVTGGYFGPSESRDGLFDGEWLRTGDRGYMTDGELVVCGRWKDMIVIGGRNISPQQVERVAERHARLTPGSVAAIGVPSAKGTEKLVLVASLPTRFHTTAMARRLVRAVHAEVGVTAADIVFVMPGAIPRTASGKLQRYLCRQWYLDGAFDSTRAPA
jgi:fatty-acyl-CoA synthase